MMAKPENTTNYAVNEDETDNCYNEVNTVSRTAVVVKWVASVILLLLFLMCLVHSKISLLALSEAMNANNNLDLTARSRIFVMLQIVALVPHVINIARGIWHGGLRRDKDSSFSWKKWILATLLSSLESLGISLFIFCIPAFGKPHLTILLMSCVFFFPSWDNLRCLWNTRKDQKKADHPETAKHPESFCYSKKVLASLLFSLISQIIGIGLTGYLLRNVPIRKLWIVPMGVVCVSISWIPSVQKFLDGPRASAGTTKDSKNSAQNETPTGNAQDSSNEAPNEPSTGNTQDSSNSAQNKTLAGNDKDSRNRSLDEAPAGNAQNSINGDGNTSTGNTRDSSNSIRNETPKGNAQDTSNSTQNQTSAENAQYTSNSTRNETSAWKLTTWMSFVKLILTLGCSVTIYFNDMLSPFPDGLLEVDIQTYKDGLKGLTDGSDTALFYFVTHITEGFIGYLLGYIACTTRSQLPGFSIPLVAATPLSVILLTVFDSCRFFLLYPGDSSGSECVITDTDKAVVALATICLVLAQVLSNWRLLFETPLIAILGENQLFWTPMYNSVLLEQWIMLSRRKDEGNGDFDPVETARRSRIFICTTMYRETEDEMKQLLESLKKINDRVARSDGLTFESHIFFDGAVKNGIPSEFLIQLVALVEKTLGTYTGVDSCTKTMTPYGMSLSWELKSDKPLSKDDKPVIRNGMPLTIHLKDNSKVKSKKRWSQIMYMSYVLDQKLKTTCEKDKREYDVYEESYILTTDADVKFTPDNVEALLDLITLDYSIGAVCARTHPLGSGPLVWYQKFEYAIGHWFQKAAEHVIGCVLCSPGCFSVYRCKAIKQILKKYATDVEKAAEFLTKDMGEDRWFCTLMVQKGWRIEYCAASENGTHCPEDFDEFFKQRRRWIASTLANIWLLIKQWKDINTRKHNLRFPFLFLIYQVILLVATLIGPSSIILVVSGGLAYGKNWNQEATLTLQLMMCVCFTIICLYTSQKVQLFAAKCFSCLYAIIMVFVIVGTAVQVSSDIHEYPGSEDEFISDKIRISTQSVYLCTIAGLFVITGGLHLREITCLFHGLIYLLFLPSGYLILMIYSICNITDSSWGTRESTEQTSSPTNTSWRRLFKEFICCTGKRKKDNTNGTIEMTSQKTQDSVEHNSGRDQTMRIGKTPLEEMQTEATSHCFSAQSCSRTNTSLEEWLHDIGPDMVEYAKIFRENGFTDTTFISGMTENEIKSLGIENIGRTNALLRGIEKLPDYEIDADVPKDVESWLQALDLHEYIDKFEHSQITTQKDMEILTSYSIKDIKKELKITKMGHIKRLQKGIEKLRKPTQAEMNKVRIREQLMDKTCKKDSNLDTYWEGLRDICLKPLSAVFESNDHLKAKLAELRIRWLAIFAMINILWLVLIYTLADKGDLLGLFGSNLVGFLVIVLYGFVLIVQFLAMVFHRIFTLMHFLARTPYKFNSTYNGNWMFDNRTRPENGTARLEDDAQPSCSNVTEVNKEQHIRKGSKSCNQKGKSIFNGKQRGRHSDEDNLIENEQPVDQSNTPI